jgi:SH3-like domain-containing protein
MSSFDFPDKSMSSVTKFFKVSLISSLVGLGAMLAALPAMARPAVVQADANVRSAPSVNAPVLEILPQRGLVEVTRIQVAEDGQTWYYTKSKIEGTAEGWVRSDLLGFFNQRNLTYGTLGGVAGDRINIRSAPRMDSEVRHYGLMGDVVQVDGSKSNDGYLWRHVTFPNGAAGWVRYDLISVE